MAFSRSNPRDDVREARRGEERIQPRGDQRKRAERDRDRILYSPAFRRLAGVAQVASPDSGHVLHNRLTHSLKVAQLAQRLAQLIEQESDANEMDAGGGLDPNVVEAASLAHDIGHPPFGHPAEDELDRRILENGAPGGFEGNAQSFRIVATTAVPRPGTPGLDLTRATLNAMLKYPWNREGQPEAFESEKWGYYSKEAHVFGWVREEEFADTTETCVEAEIMDWADDVTYAVHDVEDFYRAGLLPLDQLLQPTRERRIFAERCAARRDDADINPEFVINFLEEKAEPYRGDPDRDEILKPFRGTRNQLSALSSLSSRAIKKYLGIEARLVNGGDPAGVFVDWGASPRESSLRVRDDFQREVRILKDMTWLYVIENPALAAQQEGHRKIVGTLFQKFFDAAADSADIVPARFRTAARDADDPRSRARLASDIICSMTDAQAIAYYNRLMGTLPGSVQNPVFY